MRHPAICTHSDRKLGCRWNGSESLWQWCTPRIRLLDYRCLSDPCRSPCLPWRLWLKEVERIPCPLSTSPISLSSRFKSSPLWNWPGAAFCFAWCFTPNSAQRQSFTYPTVHAIPILPRTRDGDIPASTGRLCSGAHTLPRPKTIESSVGWRRRRK